MSLGPSPGSRSQWTPRGPRAGLSGAAEKSENNSSNSDIVPVGREEIPEGVGAARRPALMADVPQEPSPLTSLFVELGEEEAEAAPAEASEPDGGVLPPQVARRAPPQQQRSGGGATGGAGGSG